MATIVNVFKKSPQERLDAKKAKKEWFKELKKIKPDVTHRTAKIGLKPAKSLSDLKALLNLAETAKVMWLSAIEDEKKSSAA